jgi:Ca-activated chloride channel homolog
MSFGAPYFLLLLLVVPAAIAVLLALRRRPARETVSFTNVDLLASLDAGREPRRHLAALGLFAAALAAAFVALAEPHVSRPAVTAHATVVLTVDTSGSMNADDLTPSRLGAAEAAMAAFANRVPPSVRIALVAFSSVPGVVVPATSNRTLLAQGIDELGAGGGTAIGDALQLAVQVAVRATGGPHATTPTGRRHRAAIILLSDGAQTNGDLSPLAGAALARAAHIPVYTVALGTTHVRPGIGPYSAYGFGGDLKPDPRTLAAIAQETGGHAYQAASAGSVFRVYRTLSTRLIRQASDLHLASWCCGAAAFLLFSAILASAYARPTLP